MGLWKDKTRKDWCYKFQYQKKQHGSRGYSTKKEAIAARAEHRQRIINDSKPRQESMGFRLVASLYLDDAKRRFVPKTYKYKASVYRSFLEYHGDMPIEEITPSTIDSYLKSRPSNHNYNVHRKELSALFSFAFNNLELLIKNPVSKVSKLPHTSTRKNIPSEEQIAQLLTAADPKKERPLIACVLHLAARVDEILRLTWEDIDFKNRTVTRWTRKRKGGQYEPITAHMNQDLYTALMILEENKRNDKWIFYNPGTGTRYKQRRKMLKSVCERAGINPPILFHELRHFIASLLANENNVSKKTISDLLGHKSLTTTEIYLHSIGESQKTAIQSLEGRFTLKI